MHTLTGAYALAAYTLGAYTPGGLHFGVPTIRQRIMDLLVPLTWTYTLGLTRWGPIFLGAYNLGASSLEPWVEGARGPLIWGLTVWGPTVSSHGSRELGDHLSGGLHSGGLQSRATG